MTTRLSTKGQIIVPKSIRISRAWKPGTELIVEETQNGILLRPARQFPETSLEEVAGCLRSKQSRTIEEMSAAVARAAAQRHDRGRY